MILKEPALWAHEKGLYILDWDGWRGPEGRPVTDQITEAEFDRRVVVCTIATIDALRKSGWNV